MPKPKPIDLCDFWALHENEYPSLARMAFDIISIPAMSAECERVFSSTKLLLTDRRARMKEDIIEASECLRAWFKAKRFDHWSGIILVILFHILVSGIALRASSWRGNGHLFISLRSVDYQSESPVIATRGCDCAFFSTTRSRGPLVSNFFVSSRYSTSSSHLVLERYQYLLLNGKLSNNFVPVPLAAVVAPGRF